MRTAPSPDAPTVVLTKPAPSAPLKVPTLADLMGQPKVEPVVPGSKGPGVPGAKLGLDEVLGAPPGSHAPIIPPANEPPDEPVDDEIEIDTTIMPDRPGAPPKGKSDFARERQQSKSKKIGLEEAERLRDEAVAETTRIKLEAQNERQEREKATKELEEFRALAGTRQKDIDDLNSRYFENFKPAYDVGSDSEVVTAHKGMFKALEDNMPAYVETSKGSKRVMFQQLATDPKNASILENAMLHYAQAQQTGDEEIMNAAVSTAAAVLGSDVEFFGRGDQRNRLLSNDDPIFRQIETAMVRGLPHLKSKLDRAAFIRENEPKLAEERFTVRQRAITGELNSAFEMKSDEIVTALKGDPTDSRALFTAVLNSAPALREQVNARIAKTAEALSSVPDQLMMPPLKSNDKVAVAEHRKMYQERKKELSELARFAIIGQSCGPIMASLIAERDAANERAEAAASNTNPGSSRAGDQQQVEKDVEIETTIMPPPPGR